MKFVQPQDIMHVEQVQAEIDYTELMKGGNYVKVHPKVGEMLTVLVTKNCTVYTSIVKEFINLTPAQMQGKETIELPIFCVTDNEEMVLDFHPKYPDNSRLLLIYSNNNNNPELKSEITECYDRLVLDYGPM